MRREKNRVAAQKSRKRQTQRADELHEVCLCDWGEFLSALSFIDILFSYKSSKTAIPGSRLRFK